MWTLEKEELPSKEEDEEVIKQMKNNKSPGVDGIKAEMFKHGGKKIILLRKIWRQERLPREWTEAVLCPIFKKGDRTICKL